MINLSKHSDSRVDLEVSNFEEYTYLKFVRSDSDTGSSHFTLVLDPVDLEHFIATLIELGA